ncbi:hypothetical protein T01_16031, partial [Trichinella spiralis]
LMREIEKPKTENSAAFHGYSPKLSKKTDLAKHDSSSKYKLENYLLESVESHLEDIGDLIWLLVLIDLDLGSELPDSTVSSVFGSSIRRQLIMQYCKHLFLTEKTKLQKNEFHRNNFILCGG